MIDRQGAAILQWFATWILATLALVAVVLGQPGNLPVDQNGFDRPAASAAQVARFDCWTALNPRPGAIPGGVLITRGDSVRHSASDTVTGHYLNHLGSRHLAAFCTR